MKMIFSKRDKTVVLYDRFHVFENSFYPDRFDHLFAFYFVFDPDLDPANDLAGGFFLVFYQKVEMPPNVEMFSSVNMPSNVEMFSNVNVF